MLDYAVDDFTAGGERYGGAITAALLLKEFAGDGPWAHLDIASVADTEKAQAYCPIGATGFGVRLLVEALRTWPRRRARTR